jgi:hypothetical protein
MDTYIDTYRYIYRYCMRISYEDTQRSPAGSPTLTPCLPVGPTVVRTQHHAHIHTCPYTASWQHAFMRHACLPQGNVACTTEEPYAAPRSPTFQTSQTRYRKWLQKFNEIKYRISRASTRWPNAANAHPRDLIFLGYHTGIISLKLAGCLLPLHIKRRGD